jgi:outer membrane protein assembly factor BamD
VHVAQYYYSRGAYIAAVNRAQAALTEYSDAPSLESALYILVKSYDALEMPQLRDDAKRVLAQTYPNSTILQGGIKRDSGPWWKVW